MTRTMASHGHGLEGAEVPYRMSGILSKLETALTLIFCKPKQASTLVWRFIHIFRTYLTDQDVPKSENIDLKRCFINKDTLESNMV